MTRLRDLQLCVDGALSTIRNTHTYMQSNREMSMEDRFSVLDRNMDVVEELLRNGLEKSTMSRRERRRME